jgi:hypothetical protein
MFNIYFFFENRAVSEIMSINIIQPKATDDNMVHVRCMVDKQGYTRARANAHAHAPGHPHKHTHTHTHRSVQYLLLFDGYNCFANEPHYYVIRTLSVLLVS